MTSLHLKALLFDIFGTVFNWRTPVTKALRSAISPHLPPNTSPSPVYESIAEEWRKGYMKFTTSYNPSTDPWITIDAFHLRSIRTILEAHGLGNLLSEAELQDLNLVWHRLEPWEDSREGVRMLGERYVTATLSNGNTTLLDDLQKHGNVRFRKTFSAEDFKAYKPNPKVYLGAVERLGLKPAECAMVAAHLHDLKAAKDLGLRCIYIERKGEESWDEKAVEKAKRDGWVDVWIDFGNKGLESAASELQRLNM